MMKIVSLSNPKVKQWMKYHKKKYRDKDRCFLVEGEHLIEEAKQAKILKTLLVREGFHYEFDEVYELSNEIMDRLCVSTSKENVIGVCDMLNLEVKAYDRILLLDDVQDPGNMGTLIRSAYSFGFDAVYVSKQSVDLYNEKVIRSTQGAMFHIPVICESLENLIPKLRKMMPVYATSLRNATSLSKIKVSSKVAIVLGNEGNGVKNTIIDLCDASIMIEMSAFESLNVAVAGGICMYYFRKD